MFGIRRKCSLLHFLPLTKHRQGLFISISKRLFVGRDIMARLKLTITQWFVEPADKFTNDVIAGYLAEQPNAGDAAMAGLEDTGGNRHDVWQVAHSTITRLEASKNSAPLAFRVYLRHGPRGPISLWKFPARKHPKLTRASELESPKKQP